MKRAGVTLLAALFVTMGAAVLAAGWLGAQRKPRHTPGHIDCKHHNHGPKWHAGHAKAVAVPLSRYRRNTGPDGEAVFQAQPESRKD